MKYLENKLCDFEILTEWDRSKKYNILSACFFKMNNHYKNFNTYIKGLKNIVILLNSQSKYVLRIFIDEHIKSDNNIYTILKSSNKIQIVLFKCLNYLDKKSFHIDVFGALVRLFPIFNFNFNDALNVIVIDIDLNFEDINKLKILLNYNTEKKEIIGMGMIDRLLITKYKPHFYCGLFGIFNIKFDKSIILNFILNAPNIKDTGIYNKRITSYGYGTDELFINDYFLYSNSLQNIKGIKLGMLINYDINWFLYHYKNELLHDKASITYSNLKFILGKFYKSYITSEEMFNLIDKLIYKKKSSDPIKIYLSNNYSKLIKDLYTKKLEWFCKENIKLIYKYFLNIVDCLGIIYFNPSNLEILNVKILKKNII